MANKNSGTWDKIIGTLRTVWRWIYRLRSVVLAVPVLVAAIALAIYNMTHLPEIVALNMTTSGEFTQAVTRGVAVMGPLALTAICLMLMFFSKRVLYPWLVSVFTLVLPLLFLFAGAFS